MYLGHGNRFVGGHLHTIGNRCWCGYLAVPVRFHTRSPTGKVIEDGQAEERSLGWLGSDEKPDYVNPPVMAEVLHKTVTQTPVTQPPVGELCNKCGKPRTGRGKVCNKCRQAAYRERRAT